MMAVYLDITTTCLASNQFLKRERDKKKGREEKGMKFFFLFFCCVGLGSRSFTRANQAQYHHLLVFLANVFSSTLISLSSWWRGNNYLDLGLEFQRGR